jgi:hypothetical protein
MSTPSASQRIWDMIISSVISIVITIVFGYYFIYVGEKQREPTFYLDPVKTMIIDRENAGDAPIQLLKPNNDTIKSDVISAYIYFFNQGLETIKRENVYSPLKIRIDSGEILYYKIMKVARTVSGIKINRDTLDKSLIVDFVALEKDDGFVAQVIYEGKIDSKIILEGGIDGAKSFSTELTSVDPIYVLVSAFIFLIAAYILLVMYKGSSAKMAPRFLFVFSAIPALYLLMMIYKTEWFIDHKVPETLRIEHYVEQSTRQVFQLPAWFGK